MQYQKLQSGKTIIEFHNNWFGVETVIVNGQIVSQLSSVWGTNHFFSIMEDGHTARYILTTRVTQQMQVVLDLTRNGEIIQQAVPVKYGGMPKKPEDKFKKEGLKYLKDYDLDDCLEAFRKSLEFNPKDPETYFHMACAHSVLENTEEGYECLKLSVENGLKDTEQILNHDMLAFLRMDPAFEDFLSSGFTSYSLGDRKDNE